ncbi:MAG TPA: TadE family protein, partial [Anaeromyxobacteraceae bacterium]|nr:TadE family protein [Anaeromyxobacteraceae bacterium]
MTSRARIGEDGQAMVESALVFPTLIFAVLGILQLTMMQQARLMTEYAAFNAARAGAVWNMDVERMHKAAVLTLLPTMPTTPASNPSALPLRVDSLPALGARFEAFYQANRLSGDAFGKKAIEVEILNPTQADFKDDEIDFDEVGPGSLAARRPTQLTIRLTYFYELRVPIVNAILFESWLAVRAGIALRSWDPMRPRLYGTVPGVSRSERLSIEAARAEADCSWNGIDQKAIRRLSGVAVASKAYYIPLVTTYTIRMQSNPFKRFAPPRQSGCEAGTAAKAQPR